MNLFVETIIPEALTDWGLLPSLLLLNRGIRGYLECHVGGDFLLIYQVEESDKPGMVVFVRTGTQAELF